MSYFAVLKAAQHIQFIFVVHVGWTASLSIKEIEGAYRNKEPSK